MQTIDEHHTGQKKRPDLLTILCILTFIGSGLAAFSNLILFLTYDEMDVLMEEMNVDFEEVMLLPGNSESCNLFSKVMNILYA